MALGGLIWVSLGLLGVWQEFRHFDSGRLYCWAPYMASTDAVKGVEGVSEST